MSNCRLGHCLPLPLLFLHLHLLEQELLALACWPCPSRG